MTIVIDIPEHIYEHAKEMSEDSGDEFEAMRAIANGSQQRTGRWIVTDDDLVYCSECEDSYYPRPIDASWYYCPQCGARMEVEE